jgi:hypothetical protein
MNMTHNKTRVTYFKVKHVDDDSKECLICSAVSLKQLLFLHKKTAKESYIGSYMRKNGGRKKWVYDILETKLCETSQERYRREYELHIEHNIKPSVVLTYACRVYKNV